jgi:hypothetical protein
MLRESEDTYRAYLLRLWQVQTEQGLTWRASLEAIPSGERRAFASLEALVAYLGEETTGIPPPEGAEEEGS